jgi:hypothetical protein
MTHCLSQIPVRETIPLDYQLIEVAEDLHLAALARV